MDELAKNSFNLLKQEIDINLNELFTIDFGNLKILLTTILNNQQEMSKRIKNLENNEISMKKEYLDKMHDYDNIILTPKKYIIEKSNREELEILPSVINFDIVEKKDNLKEEQNEKNDLKKENNDNQKKEDGKIDQKKFDEVDEGKKIEEENKIDEEKKIDEKIEEQKDDSEVKKLNENSSGQNKISRQVRVDEIISKEEIISLIEEILTKEKIIDNNMPQKGNQNLKLEGLTRNYNMLLSEMTNIKNKIKEFDEMKNLERQKIAELYSLKSKEKNFKNEESEFIKQQLKDLSNTNNSLEKEIQALKTSMNDLNLFELFNNVKTEEGNIDAAKALVVALEKKVFSKTKQIDDNLKQFHDRLNPLEVDRKTNKNNFELVKANIQEMKKNEKILYEQISEYKDINKNLTNDVNDFKKNIIQNNNNIEKKCDDILKNYSDYKDNSEKNISQMIKRLNDNDKKLSDLESTLKQEKKIIDDSINKRDFENFKMSLEEVIKNLQAKDSNIEDQINILKNDMEFSKIKELLDKIREDFYN